MFPMESEKGLYGLDFLRIHVKVLLSTVREVADGGSAPGIPAHPFGDARLFELSKCLDNLAEEHIGWIWTASRVSP